jgi:multidrug efflux system membrane fusion protein
VTESNQAGCDDSKANPRENSVKRSAIWTISGLLTALASGAAYMTLQPQSGAAQNSAAAVPPRPIPVTSGVVEVRDFPIYRVGLGTVQAYNTVTIKVRVDGEVQKIAFREGQDVQTGDILAQIDPRTYQAQLHQAEADKARDEALLANARLDLERFSTLAVKEFATRQSVDTQKALVAQFQAAIQRDQAAIDNANVSLGYTTIISPINGRTGIRLIDQGNIVHANDATGLVVIAQLNPISVIFTLPQRNLPDIADAMRKGKLAVFAYDQDNRTQLGEGRLELIDNQIDQGTGSLRLKAVFPNEDNKLWPGEFVSAWLQLGVSQGPVVADSVVQSGPEGSYALAIRPDNSIEIRPLRVTASQQGYSLIAAGLVEGERVVVDGQYRLRNGSRIAEAAKSKPAPAPPKSLRPMTE